MASKEQIIQEKTVAAAVKNSTNSQPNFVGNLAEEIAKVLAKRFPNRPKSKKKKKVEKKKKEAEGAFFLDTSAIIDGRIFDVIELGLLSGYVVVIESILLELKHIADSQDLVKRERGQRGLKELELVKKVKHIKLLHLAENEKAAKMKEVDEKLLEMTKNYKGRLITCDYNLEKKASVTGVTAVNIQELANRLKIIAVPGESLHLKVQHVGKDPTQGVGYLDDGTMVVVEHGADGLEHFMNVVVSRVIQTSSGRILFAKKI